MTLGRSSFAIAFGVVVGAGAALIGVQTAAIRGGHRIAVTDRAAELPGPESAVVDASKPALDQVGALDGLIGILALRPGERIESIGSAPADASSIAAAWLAAEPGDYLDFYIARPSRGHRRVLVLVH